MSQEQLDRILPPIDGDRSRLYLGARAPTDRTYVTFHDFGPAECSGPLPEPPVSPPSADGSPFDWGATRDYRAVCVLASALLVDACGPVACRRLWREFAQEVVRLLPADDWELSAGRIHAWVTRRLPAPPAQQEGGADGRQA